LARKQGFLMLLRDPIAGSELHSLIKWQVYAWAYYSEPITNYYQKLS